MSSDLQTQLTEAEKSFKKACEQIIHLNRRLDEMAKRYDKASRENHRSFRYSLRLRMAVSEGVRNMYYEYAANKADMISELRHKVAGNGSANRSIAPNNNVANVVSNSVSLRRDVNAVLSDRAEGEQRERDSARDSGSSARTNPNVVLTRRVNKIRHRSRSGARRRTRPPVSDNEQAAWAENTNMVPALEGIVEPAVSATPEGQYNSGNMVQAMEGIEEPAVEIPEQVLEGIQEVQYGPSDVILVPNVGIPEPAMGQYDSSDMESPSAGSSGSTVASSEAPEDLELVESYFTTTSDYGTGSQPANSDWTQ